MVAQGKMTINGEVALTADTNLIENDITADSITGFYSVSTMNGNSKLTVGKTLSVDYIENKGTIVIKSGAAVTISQQAVCSDDAVIKLEKGAKPVNIGRNFNVGEYTAIKLAKANDTDNFDGEQIFSVPTAKDFDFDAFAAKVNIDGITSGGTVYESKLVNNKGKVTLEAKKFKVTDPGNNVIGDSPFTSWKEAVDAIDASGKIEATITLLGDTTLTKMELPKTARLNISSDDKTLTLKGVTSLSPKNNLDYYTAIVCVDSKNAPAPLTITVPACKKDRSGKVTASYALILSNLITCKSLTLKGGSGSRLIIVNYITADSITGFHGVTMTNGNSKLTVGKTLSADYFENKGTILIKNGATVTVNENFKGDGTVKLEKGAKPVNIGRNFNVDEYTAIKLAKANENDNFDGEQIFSVPTTWTAEQFEAFKANVDYTGLKSGDYTYDLVNNKGKVTLVGYVFRLSGTGITGSKDFAAWADVIAEINKNGDKTNEYTVTFLGESCKVDMAAAFKLPYKDKYKKLTIKNGKIIFNGKTITLTGNLTLDSTDIYDKNGNERVYGTDYTVNDSKGKYTFEVKAAQP